MVNDALGLLFLNTDLNVAVNTALSTNGTDLNIGRGGLNDKSQVVAYVQKASANRDLVFNIYMSLNNDTFRLIRTLTFPLSFKGKKAVMIGEDLPWQRWLDSEIMLRCNVVAANSANAGDWDRVAVYLGAGEETVIGRQAGAADTLMDA